MVERSQSLFVRCWQPEPTQAHCGCPPVQALIEGGADVDKASNDGATPLYMAAQKGQLKVLHLLVKATADINKSMNGGVTPLMVAAWQGHADCLRLLLGAGADAAAVMTGDNELIGVGPGTTALQIATTHGKKDCRAVLL